MKAEGKTLDMKAFAGSIGVIVDRSSSNNRRLASAWVIAEDKVATCAHAVAPFADQLAGLKVFFPAAGVEMGVTKAMFHPKFQRRSLSQVDQDFTSDVSKLALEKHNAVVLSLGTSLPELSNAAIIDLNRRLTRPAPQREQAMGGSLHEIDLSLVVQTINNARKAGVLVIADERNNPIAQIYCEDGRVFFAQHEHLIGEMAFYQIFAGALEGSFYFMSFEESEWRPPSKILRPTEAMLLESHRRVDELGSLKQLLGGMEGLWRRRGETPPVEGLPPEAAQAVSRVWPLLDGATPASQLFRLCGLDDYLVFNVLVELKRNGHIEEISEERSVRNARLKPIPVASQLPLSPYDELTNLSIDSYSGRMLIRSGSLLGTLRAQDPWHLVHNMPLLSESAGSPLLKDGLVVGMHCGRLPSSPDAEDAAALQQMLWVDSVMQCLAQGGEEALAKKLTQTGIELAPLPPPNARTYDPGCREVARVNCPRCGSSSLESARFCKSCGQSLIQDLSSRAKKPNLSSVLAAATTMLVLAAGFVGAAFSMPQPHIIEPDFVTVPQTPWLSLVAKAATVPQTPGERGTFRELPAEAKVKNGDIVYLKVNLNDPCYVYLFALPTSSGAAQLLYPTKPEEDTLRHSTDFFTFPPKAEEFMERANEEATAFVIANPPGVDTFIAVASHSPSVILQKPELVDRVFKRAKLFLDQHDNLKNIEVDATALGDDVFSDAGIGLTAPGQDERKPVFLTRLKLIHRQ